MKIRNIGLPNLYTTRVYGPLTKWQEYWARTTHHFEELYVLSRRAPIYIATDGSSSGYIVDIYLKLEM